MELTGNDNRMPDPDAIKVFIGQIPKQWNENDVRVFFEKFGEIYMVNVLRDRLNKQSRGCCFVTYYTRKAALEAQNACHNLLTLPGMNHPLQLKPADNENRAERKLFVGMLSKKTNETELRNMFSKFGLVEESSILRDAMGHSRGCGFITYSSRLSALSAIQKMHQSLTSEGCSSPIVVKFADVRAKEKAPPMSQLGSTALSNLGDTNAKVFNLLQQHQRNFNTAAASNTAHVPTTFTLGGINATSIPSLAATPTDISTLTFLTNLAATVAPNALNHHAGSNLLQQTVTGGHHNPGGATITSPLCSRLSANLSILQQNQMEGPDGANLFIYHLPQEFTDTDLLQAFMPFGTVVSSKVFIDKATNLSKCFGFISYDNPQSAQYAIQALNGFQIGTKRLKVQLKRSRDKPY